MAWHHTSLSCVNHCLLSLVGLNYVQQTHISCSSQEYTQPLVPIVFITLCLHRGKQHPVCFAILICLSDFRLTLKAALFCCFTCLCDTLLLTDGTEMAVCCCYY